MGFFSTLASGSQGNCGIYISGDARILIDAGRSAKYITESLRAAADLSPCDLTHILITHGHSDHISALRVLKKHTSATLVCSHGTMKSIDARGWNTQCFNSYDELELLGCRVKTLPTPHDAPGSCGFVLGAGEDKLAYFTDIGEMQSHILQAMTECENVVIESNHDLAMLVNGMYPYHLRQRIASAGGHLSNKECADSVTDLAKSGVKRIMLAHLSRENNRPEIAHAQSMSALEKMGKVADIELFVAPNAAPMTLFSSIYAKG